MLVNKILCLGSNGSDSDIQCRQIAQESNISYRGLLSSIPDNLLEGCYHTSLADISDYTLIESKDKFDKIIFLDNLKDNTVLETNTMILKNIFNNVDTELKKVPANSILYAGCSHTAGIGHDDTTTVFPTLFSNLQNKTPFINGFPGKGNYIIEDFLSEYCLHKQDVIIQFIDIFRIRYFDSKTNTVISTAGKYLPREQLEIFDEPRLAWEFERMVDRIVARLRVSSARFLFFQLTPQHDNRNRLQLYMSKYKEFCYVPTNVLVDYVPDGHFGIKTHQNIASLLKNKWDLLYA